jgi:prevent-host-death family protein
MTLTTTRAREAFSEILNRAAYGKERVVLTRRGKKLAAVIPVEDLALLEELENRLDADEARRAIEAAARKGEKPVRWSKVKKDLGL